MTTIFLGALGWFLGSILTALLFGRLIAAADRHSHGEQRQTQPFTKRSRGGFQSFHRELDK